MNKSVENAGEENNVTGYIELCSKSHELSNFRNHASYFMLLVYMIALTTLNLTEELAL